MGSDVDATDDEQNALLEVRYYPDKHKRTKVPKRVLKAEREKLKREHLNEHFLKLASVLELNEQNSGKASILGETIRFVKEMISQIKSLRQENAALLSESQYVTAEKNELKDENSAMETQITKLHTELEARVAESKPDLNTAPPEYWQAQAGSLRTGDPSVQQAPPVLGPLYVIPLGSDLQAYHKPDTPSNPSSVVTKPHARYPAPTDSWPPELLARRPETTFES